jgi:hypothetical protein
MGMIYVLGNGVTRDFVQGVEWYRKAAQSGLPQAQDALRIVADAGYLPAQHVLGMIYENGWGTTEIDGEAAYWYRKAAEEGYPPAQYDLGRLLADGKGVVKNDAEAKQWFQRAAEKGLAEAQKRLGNP